ncbi:HAD family hydrolase [Streptomyces sp. NPDC059460]|uniref:HAD family hydrolase n=1 Tax=Streptomyces sp. NPDC059460 TaxID=3346840 RepID=UPI0036AA0F27
MPGFGAVAFDCDGVLADTDDAWAAAERTLMENHGGTMAEELRDATHGLDPVSTVDVLARAMPGSVDREALRAELLDDVGRRLREAPKAIPGAAEAVAAAALRGPVAVVSNTPSALLHPLLTALGVRERLAGVVAGDEVARPKPAPDPYCRAAALLGVPPAHLLVVEDSATGVSAARAAGAAVISVRAPGRGTLDGPIATLPDMWAVGRWLAGDYSTGNAG